MFLREFSKEQQHALLTLVRAIVRADGMIDDREQHVLEHLVAEGAIPIDFVDMPIDEASSLFIGASDRRAALLELVAVSWVDGQVADPETELLDCLADEWSIGPDERARMEDWVGRQIALYAEARAIVGLER